MYGFKPQHARGKPVQNFADGGIVHSIKGALGMRPKTPEELLAADAKPVEPRGFVSGKGTGTSDSIKARLSNGEYVLPADTVKAVGVEALDALRAATHAPVKHEQAKAARGFFVGGTPGGVDEEKRKNSFGDAAAVARDPGVTQVGGLANNGGADASRFAQVPAPIGTQPNRTPEPAASSAPLSAPQPAAQTGPAEVPLGQRHSTGARSGGQMIADGATSGVKSFFDSFQKQPEAPAVAAPVQAVQKPLPGGVAASMAGAGRGAVNQATGALPSPTNAPSPAATTEPTVAPAATGNVTRIGNSYSGGNVAGNISINGQAPRNGGQVSAQNMAAGDALAQRSQQESMSRISAQQPAGFAPSGMTAPTVRHSGNDWQSRNELRNAQVSASSIMNNGGRWDQHKGVSPERAYAAALQGADIAARAAQSGVDVAAMRENAGIQREGIQQTGATTRTGMQEQGANARAEGRNAIERDEFGLKKDAAGFQTRAAKRLEDLQTAYQDPKKTPEERSVIAQQLRELQGKNAPAEWGVQVTPSIKNVDGSTTEGSVYRYNKATGQTERVDGGREAAQALPPKDQLKTGQTYSTPRGPARWDGSQFIPV